MDNTIIVKSKNSKRLFKQNCRRSYKQDHW